MTLPDATIAWPRTSSRSLQGNTRKALFVSALLLIATAACSGEDSAEGTQEASETSEAAHAHEDEHGGEEEAPTAEAEARLADGSAEPREESMDQAADGSDLVVGHELDDGDADGLAEEASDETNAADEQEAARASIEDALNAARAAESGESNRCDRAYAGLLVVLERMRDRYAEQTRDTPDEDAFLSMCAELPVPVQECLSPTFATDNQALCAQRTSSLSEEQAERLETVLGG